MKTSVLIPCYKRIKFTKFCIPLAVLNAGMDATWYLIDDGSEDGTAEFLQKFMEDHSELDIVVILHEENWGCAKTRNEAVKKMMETDVEIIVNCDNDLLVPINWLRDLVYAMERAPWVSGGATLMANDTNIKKQLSNERELSKLPKYDWIPVKGCGGTLEAYRREVFEKGIYWNETLVNWVYEDAVHHRVMQEHGFKLAIFTGVQTWMVERLIWDDHEIEKLKNRHMARKGNMEGFEESLKEKRGSMPW